MRKTVGIAMIMIGVVFGVWAGVWWAFIGGIVNIIDAIKAPVTIPLDVALGIAKVLFCALIGWGAALLLIIPGFAIAGGHPGRRW